MINMYLTNHITRYNQVQRICLNFDRKVKGDNFYPRKFSITSEEKFSKAILACTPVDSQH